MVSYYRHEVGKRIQVTLPHSAIYVNVASHHPEVAPTAHTNSTSCSVGANLWDGKRVFHIMAVKILASRVIEIVQYQHQTGSHRHHHAIVTPLKLDSSHSP